MTNYEKANITPEELEVKIQEYFTSKDRMKVIESITTKQKKYIKVYTLPGLAWYLGFESREGFKNAMNNKKNTHSFVLKRAYIKIQEYIEEQLFITTNSNPIFVLKNMDYSDNQTVNQTVTEVKKPEIVTQDKETGKQVRKLFKVSEQAVAN
jgi:hypothetical protein